MPASRRRQTPRRTRPKPHPCPSRQTRWLASTPSLRRWSRFGSGKGSSPRSKCTSVPPGGVRTMSEITYLEAIREGLFEEMERDKNVFCLGEDNGAYGGAFKV